MPEEQKFSEKNGEAGPRGGGIREEFPGASNDPEEGGGDGPDEENSRGRSEEMRRPATSVTELLNEHLCQSAMAANPRLRANLMGTVMLSLSDSGEKYLFDWSGDTPSVALTDKGAADCCITLRGSDLLRISNGDLNPQIAMLSDKISVQGRASLAIYFFNLIVPRIRRKKTQD